MCSKRCLVRAWALDLSGNLEICVVSPIAYCHRPRLKVSPLTGVCIQSYPITFFKIKMVCIDIGGDLGRKVSIFCEDGSFHVEKISRIVAAG